MLLKWKADSSSNIPLYAQLADYLRAEIKSGNLKKGIKFPGRDKMAAMLGISRNTFVAAYHQLISEGVLVSRPKSGIFVSYTHEYGSINWQQYTARARHKTSTAEYKHWANADGLTNFSVSSDFDIHPYIKEVTNNVAKRLERTTQELEFSKYGLPSLRESLCDHLKTLNINAKPEDILVTSETFQRLYFVYEALMTQGSNFLHEKTNIISTISNIHSLGMNLIPVEMDDSGISVAGLKEKTAKNKYNSVIHLDPTDQAPTGIVMSKKRRQEIIRTIQEYNLPLVEVDHSANIWHDKPSLNPLKSMDTTNNIIYMGSILKYYPFDFQVSWIVADPYIIEHLSNVFLQSGVKASYYMQMLVDELIRSGVMPTLRSATKQFIIERREHALELCEKYLKSICKWKEKNCYFHFWLDFPGVDFGQLENTDVVNNIYPGYFFDKTDFSHILLCPACIKHENIEKTIKALSMMKAKTLK